MKVAMDVRLSFGDLGSLGSLAIRQTMLFRVLAFHDGIYWQMLLSGDGDRLATTNMSLDSATFKSAKILIRMKVDQIYGTARRAAPRTVTRITSCRQRIPATSCKVTLE